MGRLCNIHFILLAVSFLAVNSVLGATSLDELFKYAGKDQAFQRLMNNTVGCQSWLTNQGSALRAFAKETVRGRLEKIWQKSQVLRGAKAQGLVWRENGVTKVFNPQGADLGKALAKAGVDLAQAQIFTTLDAAAESVAATLPRLDNQAEIISYITSFPETQRLYAVLFPQGGVKVLNNNGDVLKGVSMAFDAPGSGVRYRIQDPNQAVSNPLIASTANVVFIAGMGADSSNTVSLISAAQSLVVQKNGIYKRLEKAYVQESKTLPRPNIFATDLSFSGNGKQPVGEQASLDATLLDLGAFLLDIKVRTASQHPQILVVRSAAAGIITEFVRRQDAIIQIIREKFKDKLPNLNDILPVGSKLVDHVVLVGGTHLAPEFGYDASLQQSIEDALDTDATGYRPNWPTFCWCHDLYMAIGKIKDAQYTSWEDYYTDAFKDITVDFYVGENDKQTVQKARDFYENLSKRNNHNMKWHFIAKSDHDVFSNTASNRDSYDPVTALKELMSSIQELVEVDAHNIGQLKFAARVGSGVVLPQENTRP